MRRLNVKLFLGLVAAATFVALTTFFVHQLQAGNIAQGLLHQANQADKEDRPDQCARYLVRYLEFVPDDNDSRARLGQTLANPRLAVTHRGRDKARYVMEQVLIREPDRHELRRGLVKLALDDGQLDLASEHLKVLQKKCPNDGEVAGLVGLMQEKQGKGTLALENLRRAVAQSPEAVENHVRLAALLRRLDAGQQGKQLQEAEQCVARALAKAPGDVSVLLAAAELAQDKNEAAKARDYVNQALKKNPRDVRLHVALARAELLAEKRDEAIAGLKRALTVVPPSERFELQWMLANLHLDADQLDEARAVVARLEPGSPPGTADYIQARVHIIKGQYFEGARALERVRQGFKSAPQLTLQVDLFLALCYERLEEPARQLAACQRVVEIDPGNAQGRRGLANALLALGRADAAVEQYRQLVKVNQERKQPGTGRADLMRLLLVRNLQGEVKDWRPFEDELLAAEKEEPNSLDLLLIRAEMCAGRNLLDDAKLVLTTALGQHAKSAVVWTALARVLEKQNDRIKAGHILDEAEKTLGDVVELRLARARLWSTEGGDQAKANLAKLEQNLAKFNQADRDHLLQGLAEFHQRAGTFAEAERLFRLLAEQPTQVRDMRWRLMLFDLALQAGDDAKMQKVLGEIKQLEGGELVLWNYGQAVRRIHLAKQGQKQLVAEARALLDKVASQRPTWPPLTLAKAEIEVLQGNPDQAIVNYRRALDQGVRSPQVVRQLVQLLTNQQRYDEAEQALRKLQQQAPLSADLQKIAVAVSLNHDDYARADQQVRATVPPNSTDYRDRLWLGQVLSSGRRVSAEAENELRKAVELAPAAPETWVVLVHYLANSGRKSDAEAEIKKAATKLTDAVGQLALATCFETVGQPEQARARVDAALQLQPNEINVRRAVISSYLRSGNYAGAEALLRDLVARKLPLSNEDHASARRSLALVLSSMADYRRFLEGLSLVGVNLDTKGNFVEAKADDAGEEQIARARVLATQQRKPLRARAIALLEEVNKRQTLPPDEQLLLARLYQEQGKEAVWWGKARELLQGLVSTNPRNPTYLVTLIQALLERGDLNESGRLLTRLEQLEQARQASFGAFGSVELRGQWLELRGKGPEAVDLLKKALAAPDSRPERVLLLAGLHGRLGQLKEAVDLCDKARATCPPEAFGGASVAILRTASNDDKLTAAVREQGPRVEAWLKDAIAKAPKNLTVKLQLADLYEVLGRPLDGLPLYRQVLEQDARNLVALNNLAWLLAQDAAHAEEALKSINTAIDLYGPRPGFLDTRAVVFLTLNRADLALADLERAVADAPTATKYFHLTRAHHLARNPRAALAALNLAHENGLTLQRVPPAEREMYRRLVAELK